MAEQEAKKKNPYNAPGYKSDYDKFLEENRDDVT